MISDSDGIVTTSQEQNPSFTFDKPGVYRAVLTVTDAQGEASEHETEVIAGNEPPKISFDILQGNSSFFFAGVPFGYQVQVADKEDGTLANGGINGNEVAVTIDYLPEGFDKVAIAQGHLQADASVAAATGKKLMEESDCAACHKTDSKSIGPSFKEVAAKYKDDSKAVDYLAEKVINGGSGVWGNVMMAAHPGLSKDEASNIVKYVLSLGKGNAAVVNRPVEGSYTPQIDKGMRTDGVVMIRASYKDKGANGVPPATAQDMLVLQSPNLMPGKADEMEGIQVHKLNNPAQWLAIVQKTGAYTRFNNIDLTGIAAVKCSVTVPVDMVNAAGGVIEVRIDGANGQLLGTSEFLAPMQGPAMSLKPSAPVIVLQPVAGRHDIYFVYKTDKAASGQTLMVHLGAAFLPVGSQRNKVSLK